MGYDALKARNAQLEAENKRLREENARLQSDKPEPEIRRKKAYRADIADPDMDSKEK